MKKYYLLTLLLLTIVAKAQVGIGTTTPASALDIPASNAAAPANTDGILIPRINAFPAANPTIDQNGMMVFLTIDLPGKPKGFYYWDNTGTPQWRGFGGTKDDDFYEVGTTDAPDDNADAMFHTGDVAIGKNTTAAKLDVEETTLNRAAAMRITYNNSSLNASAALRTDMTTVATTGVSVSQDNRLTINGGRAINVSNTITGPTNNDVSGVDSDFNTTGNGQRTGTYNLFRGSGASNFGMTNRFSFGNASTGVNNIFENSPSSTSIGVRNNFSDSGTGIKIGMINYIANTGNNFHYGVKNEISSTTTSSAYGIYSELGGATGGTRMGSFASITSEGNGNHFGTFSNITGSGTGEHRGNYTLLEGSGIGLQYASDNRINVSGDGVHRGVYNYIYGSGSGMHYGIFNSMEGGGNGTQYGSYNLVTNTGTGDKYGSYSRISAAIPGIHHGVYSEVLKSTGYAGYFLGRVSIGTTAANSYIFPTSRGTANQVMQTDGTGNVSWQSPQSFAWNLAGNSGIPPGSFIGTIDSREVYFRHTNEPSGVIGVKSTAFGYKSGGTYNIFAQNTSVGSNTAESNTVGLDNSAFGSEALNKSTAGSKNVAIGNSALFKQDFANGGLAYDTRNTAIGYGALYGTNSTTNINGLNNVGLGFYALANNGTGNANIAIGGSSMGSAQAGGGAMTGSGNIGLGSASLKSNRQGSMNIAIGGSNLGYNVDGADNVGIGSDALFYSTNLSGGTAIGTRAMENYGIFATGTNDNVAVGYEVLRGGANTTLSTHNAAVGYQSMTANTLGSDNAALGYQSLLGNRNAGKNVAIGSRALFSQNFINGNVAFDTNNVAVGFESLYNNNPTANTNGINNIAVGTAALKGNTIGLNNTAIGSQAMTNNTVTSGNVAIGARSLFTQSYNTGNTIPVTRNVAIGIEALYSNNPTTDTNGYGNVAIGGSAMRSNTIGYQNLAVGNEALTKNVNGINNVALGGRAVGENISGSRNTGIGTFALGDNLAGESNTGIGVGSLLANKNGSRNIAIGDSALSSQNYLNGGIVWDTDNLAIGVYALLNNNPTSAFNGYHNAAIGNYSLQNNTTGLGNTAVGFEAGKFNTTANYNTAIGNQALLNIIGGSSNTAVGNESQRSNVSGTNNVAVGGYALYNQIGGNQNTCIGNSVFPTSGTSVSNYTGIGYNVGGGGSLSNMVELGNGSVTTIRAQVTGITAYSDSRIKKNVTENVPGLDFISKLRPVTYNIDLHKQNEILYRNKKVADAEWEGKYDIESIKQTGFIAQEVAAAAKATNYDFNGVDIPKNPENLYSVNYTSFVVPLVKAVQEQQAVIEAEKVKNAQLAQEIEALKNNQQQLETRLKAIEDRINK